MSGVKYEKDPKEAGEDDLIKEVNAQAEKLGVTLEEYDVHVIHKLPIRNKNGETAPIIVKMNSRIKKEMLVKSSKEKKLPGIYFQNHLTVNNAQKMFMEARELRKKGVVKFAWERNGVIFVKKDENAEAVRMSEIIKRTGGDESNQYRNQNQKHQ